MPGPHTLSDEQIVVTRLAAPGLPYAKWDDSQDDDADGTDGTDKDQDQEDDSDTTDGKSDK